MLPSRCREESNELAATARCSGVERGLYSRLLVGVPKFQPGRVEQRLDVSDAQQVLPRQDRQKFALQAKDLDAVGAVGDHAAIERFGVLQRRIGRDLLRDVLHHQRQLTAAGRTDDKHMKLQPALGVHQFPPDTRGRRST